MKDALGAVDSVDHPHSRGTESPRHREWVPGKRHGVKLDAISRDIDKPSPAESDHVTIHNCGKAHIVRCVAQARRA